MHQEMVLACLSMNRTGTYLLFAVVLLQSALLMALLMRRPQTVNAQSQAVQRNLFLEPGTQMLVDPSGRQNVLGKVVIDLNTGDVWGFPTLSGASYPTALTTGNLGAANIPVSRPFLLAKYDFAGMSR